MPRFDRTGPNGDGAMTGRKNGLCTGNSPDTNGMGYGRGRGRGRMGLSGMGFGFRFGRRGRTDVPFEGNPETEEGIRNEIDAMKLHLSELEEQLNRIKKKK